MPWGAESQNKSLLDSLHDIFCTLPGFVEKAERLKSASEMPQLDEKLSGSLLHNVLSTLDALHQWRLEWDVLHGGTTTAATEENAAHLLDGNSSYLPPITKASKQFENLQTAAELCLFNAMVLILLRLVETLRIPLHTADSLGWCLEPSISRFGSPQRISEEIARIAPYMSEAQHGNKGIYLLSFPLHIARSRLELGSTVYERVESTLKSIHNKLGVYVPNDL